MIACTSPAGTLSDTPFRIGLSATVAWRLVISSILFQFVDERADTSIEFFDGAFAQERVDFGEYPLPVLFQRWIGLPHGDEVMVLVRLAILLPTARESLQHRDQIIFTFNRAAHPTLPSRL